MAEITLVKTTDRTLTEQERTFLYDNLFGAYINGLSESDKADWKRFWSVIKGLSAGEVVKFTFKKIRNGKYHRKFFALLNFAYDAWEPDRVRQKYKGMAVQKNFERFRSDVTIAAGYYEQTFDLDGNMKLEAKSISFAKMDDIEFEKLYSAVANVILSKVLTTYKDRAELDNVVAEVMRFL
jgi:hypothetical protein